MFRAAVVISLLLFYCSCNCHGRPLGVVSSVWTALLNTTSVVDLITTLQSNGTLLGYEDPTSHAPNATALSALVGKFANVGFNYAFQLPFMSDPQAAFSPAFAQALKSAVQITADNQNAAPVVRVVDVATNNKNFNASLANAIAAGLSQMAQSAASVGLELVVENAALRWDAFWGIMQNNSFASETMLAFDACNLAWVSDGEQGPQIALDVAPQLRDENTALLHAKQVASPSTPVLPAVEAGAIDWPALATIFNANLPNTPLLLEIASSTTLWANIQQSVSYLSNQCGFVFN